MADQRCIICRHWEESFPYPGVEKLPDEERIGVCHAMDGVKLPYTWRYTQREVMGAWGHEGEDCACFGLKAEKAVEPS